MISKAEGFTKQSQMIMTKKFIAGLCSRLLGYFISSTRWQKIVLKHKISVDRPFNYRKAFTQTDNIRPTTRQLNMKTLQNLTYQDWARKGVRPKEMYHWTINGIKHTTHKYWNGKSLPVQHPLTSGFRNRCIVTIYERLSSETIDWCFK